MNKVSDKLTPMSKVLTGLVLALMLAGCAEKWTDADMRTAQLYCSAHNGLQYIEGLYVTCNDADTSHKSTMYSEVYRKNIHE